MNDRLQTGDSRIDDVLASFDRHTVWHPALARAYNATLRSIGLARGDGRITVILGASGVGKERLATELQATLSKDASFPPVCVQIASGSSSAAVSMNLLFEMILGELDTFGRKRVITTSRLPEGFPRIRLDTQAAKLYAIHNYLQLLRPPALILDEAQYLVVRLTERQRLANLRNFSFLADKKFAPVVLLGTPDLFDAIRCADDVHRRIRPVLFERYRTAAQMPDFVSALADYDRYLAQAQLCAPGFTLVDARVRLYLACFGCVGNLHNLIYEALNDALEARHLLDAADFDTPERDLIPDRATFETLTRAEEDRVDAVLAGRVMADSKRNSGKVRTTTRRSLPVGELKQIRRPAGEGRGLKPRGAEE